MQANGYEAWQPLKEQRKKKKKKLSRFILGGSRSVQSFILLSHTIRGFTNQNV